MRFPGAFVAVASLALAAPAFAQTTAAKEKTLPPPADAKHQLTTGVIIKAEPLTKAGEPASPDSRARSIRLTINTAAVWRDYVRDQASTAPKPPRAAAALGNKSIATDGEPISADTTVVVVVTPETKIETRYRSPTDEISEGARKPEDAARVEARTDAQTEATPRVEHSTAKPTKFTADDLKPGLFVEVHYKEAKAREKATLLRVLRPVGGPQTPAGDEKSAASPK